MDHNWTPIEDYESHDSLAMKELRALASVWHDQRELLTEEQAYDKFEQKLKREWAIETGLIERLYTLDRGITKLLIEHGIHAAVIPHGRVANPEATVAIIADHEEAVEGVFQFVKDERSISTSYIKDWHALMTRHQHTVEGVDSLGQMTTAPLIRGDYKLMSNNPHRPDGSVHEYCPPEHVAAEMDRLIEMHHAHVGAAPEVEAAWLHHRFTQIHPFQDGNGRIARTLATLVFVKEGWFPLVVRERERASYIKALEHADSGNLKLLVDYFARLQRDEFVRALSIVQGVMNELRVDDTIKSIAQEMRTRRDALRAEWETAKSIAARLQGFAENRLKEVAIDLEKAMRDLLEHGDYFADGATEGDARSHYYRYQIIQTAKRLDYYASPESYRSWARLVIRNANQTELLVSFHGMGREFRGLLACSVTWFQRVETDEGEKEIGLVTPVTDDVFQINYKEPFDDAKTRFSDWLEDAIVRSLKLWQETS